jgi:hypothetical protein
MRSPSEDRLRAMAITLAGLSVAFALLSLVIGPDAYPLPGVTKDPANGPWALQVLADMKWLALLEDA